MSFLDKDQTQRDVEFIHSWYLLIICFLSLIFLLISSNHYSNTVLTAVVYFLFFKNKLSIKQFFKLLVYAFTFSFMFFLLTLLYTNDTYQTGVVHKVSFLHFYFSVYEASLNKALLIFYRLFFLTIVSMGSSQVINYTKVILYLVIHWGLKVFWGYPLLIALNSILLFKDEFERIKLSARFRGLGWIDRIFLFFPLLVFAIRHSQRGSLSLVTRGLNPHKSFYFTYALRLRDRMIMVGFFLCYVSLVAIMFTFR